MYRVIQLSNFMLFSVVLVAAFILTGCGSAQQVAEPTTTTMVFTSSPIGLEPVIILRRSGGFGGETMEWRIFTDGKVQTSVNREQLAEYSLTVQEMDEYLRWLEGSGFLSAQLSPPNRDEICCDRFFYELSVTYNGRMNHIAVLDSPDNLADGLAEAFRRLEDLLSIDI